MLSKRKQRLFLALAAAGVGIVAVPFLRAQTSSEASTHVDEQRFEVAELADPQVVEVAMALTRSVLAGRPGADDALAAYAGRRVITCAYGLAARAVCGAAEGGTLAAAVEGAARDLARRGAQYGAEPAGWDAAALKIDFVVDEDAVRWPSPGFEHSIGVHGVLVEREGATSWITPSELLEIPVFLIPGNDEKGILDEDRLRSALLQREPALGELPAEFAFTRFRTTSWVERQPVGSGIVRTYRTHAYEQPELDPEVLIERAFWAAEHLASVTDASGRIRYLYDPSQGKVHRGYNLLRHSGSTWSLIQAWARTGHDPWLEASRAAIGHLLENTQVQERHGPFGGGDTRWVRETSRIKLGGAGLGLLMLAEYTAATGDEQYLDEAQQFARYLVSAQRETGEFQYFANIDPSGPPIDGDSAYYPGEAIVGLARLYSVDPNPLWLDTAKRGAAWLIRVRDAGKTPRQLANDHWLMIGLSRLYAETKDPTWLAHSLKLAEAVAIQHERHVDHVRYHRDYEGGYYEPPRSTPAATRAEGLVAVLDTCRLAETACPEVRKILEATVRHELQTQYTPDTIWWVNAPELAFGAFYGGLADVTIRNDYVQHNLSAVLGLERLIRLEDGERLPGDPGWTSADQRAFHGLSADRITGLRASALALRGPSLWDRAVAEAERDAVSAEQANASGEAEPAR